MRDLISCLSLLALFIILQIHEHARTRANTHAHRHASRQEGQQGHSKAGHRQDSRARMHAAMGRGRYQEPVGIYFARAPRYL